MGLVLHLGRVSGSTPRQLNEILGFFIPMGSGVKKLRRREAESSKAVAHPADGEKVQRPPYLAQSSPA